MRNVFKWRIVTNKYLYLLDEAGAMPFIYNKITGERTYLEGDTGTTVVTGNTVDEGLIKEQASNIKQEILYCSKFDKMLELAQLDTDASKLTFQSCDKYFNLDSEECVEEAVTPKCEGYEPVFNVSAYTLDDSSDVEYTVFAERNEADKTLRYNLNLGIPRGKKGERGSDGVGCQGAKGDAGLPATIESVVAHATSAETATASVQMSKTGSTNSYAFTFNFGIPKGEQGPKGEDGYDGAPGPGSRIYPITASAISLEPGSDPTVDVTSNTRYNQRLNTYDTQLSLEFGIPEGYQGETGPDGLPAIIDDVSIDRVETLDADKDAYVNASVEDLGSGNTYLLHFEFGIPRGESTSGGTGYSYYDFDNIVVHTTSGALPYFVLHEDPTVDPITGSPGLRIWYEFYYPERWGQGGGTDDIKHRYDEDVDSLSEGVQEIIDGDTYPYAVASGIRSHAEGIGMYEELTTIYATIHLTNSRRDINFQFDCSEFPSGYVPEPETFNRFEITINNVIYRLYVDVNDNAWDDTNCQLTYYDFYVKQGQHTLTYSELQIFEGVQIEYIVSTKEANASGKASHTEGNGTQAKGDYSHAEGDSTTASGVASHTEGGETTVTANYGHAEGNKTEANGFATHAEGYQSKAYGEYCHAEGGYTVADGGSSHAEGSHTTANNTSHAEGNGTTASGNASHSEGNNTKARGSYSHAEGYETETNIGATAAHAEGYNTRALSNYTHAEGDSTTASYESSHAEGFGTTAYGLASHVEGICSQTTPRSITVQARLEPNCYGDNFIITIDEINKELGTAFSTLQAFRGEFSVNIIGNNITFPSDSSIFKTGYTFLSGRAVQVISGTIRDDESVHLTFTSVTVKYKDSSYVEHTTLLTDILKDSLNVTIDVTLNVSNHNTGGAYGDASHAEGGETMAEGTYSHTEGYSTITAYEAIAAHAEGAYTNANKAYSHAEGFGTTASGNASHASGIGTIANQDAMTAIGKYNVSGGTNDLFVIGNGADDTHRSNVLSVNGATNKITLNNSGGIRKESGGGNSDVWNTAGGVTSLTSFSPKNGEFNLTVDNQTKKIFEANQGTNTVFTITASGSTHVSFDNSSNTLTVTSTDTNTHRPIKINGTEILGDNITPLNLSGGTNVILTTDNTGLVTINANSSSGSVPVGCIQMYAGATAPDGWLLCQGQSIVKSTMGTSADLKNPIYDNLYDILATRTGAGGLKRIPDFQQRFPLGAKEDDFISREDKGTLRISVSSGAYSFEKPVNSPSPLTYIIDLREICATGYEFVKVASASGTGNIYSAITVVTCTEKGIVTDPTVRNLQACFNSIVITALALGSTYEVDYYSTYPTDLGKTGGEARHTLTEGELARHGHTLVTRHEKGLAGSTSNNFLTSVISSSDTDRSIISPSDSTTNTPYTTYAGNNNPHNNIPPYFAVNYIIKY